MHIFGPGNLAMQILEQNVENQEMDPCDRSKLWQIRADAHLLVARYGCSTLTTDSIT